MISYIVVGMVMMGQMPIQTMASAVDEKLIPINQGVQEVEQSGMTYYVDAINGDDSCAGTSPDAPWKSLTHLNTTIFQPGDQILLKSGGIWNGGIQPQGSGSVDAPIIMNSYTYENGLVEIGKGKKPIINGAGQVLNTIWLNNVEFWEIKNLEVTNKGETALRGRTGVLITADKDFDKTENFYVEHIYVQGVDVHDVNGDLTTKDLNNGGIYYSILEDSVTAPIIFKDILIEDCYVKDVSRTGISVGASQWFGKKLEDAGYNLNNLTPEQMAEELHQDIIIRNNYVERAGGDAIVTQYVYAPLVEYNVSQEASISTKDNPGLMYSAAIWPWECVDSVFQFNEAFDTYMNGDGQAFDCDYSLGTTYQYNYSHDNEGGFMLVCQANSLESVIRYNISENDKRTLFMTSNTTPAYIYNNTFYIGEGLNTDIFSGHYGPLEFYNNIFYTEGTRKNQNWHESVAKYDSNLYYGFANEPSNDMNKVVENPMFKDSGKGGQGTVEAGPALDTLRGYELQSESPAINQGVFIDKEYLPSRVAPVTKDFYNNEVGTFTVDIGAIDTMTIDLRPSSKSYQLNHTDKTISNVPINTPISKFMEEINVDTGVTAQLLKEGENVTEGNVEAGMMVVTTNGQEGMQYSIAELFGNTDREAPVLTGVKDTFIKIGREFDILKDVKAIDAVDGDVTSAIETNTNLNNQKAGVYTVEYRVVDEAGNVATVTRQITVVELDELFSLYDDFSGNTQGPVWFYEYQEGTNIGQMKSEDGYWKHPNNWALVGKMEDSNRISIGAAVNSYGLATFVAPKDGTVTIYDEVELRVPTSGGAVEFRIEKNGEKVWPQDANWISLSGYAKEDVTISGLEIVEGDRISFVTKYAGHSNPAILSIPTILYEKAETQLAITELVGIDLVEGNMDFEITLNLNNVEDIYAEDITVTYDKELFKLESVKGKNSTQVIESDESVEGIVRMLSMTENGLTGMQEIITMNFKSQVLEEEKAGEIKVTAAKLGSVVEGASAITNALTSNKTVIVKGKPVTVVNPGDINQDDIVDVVDLALVAYYYQSSATSPDWEQAKKADVTGDGIINIDDLTFIAQKILGD